MSTMEAGTIAQIDDSVRVVIRKLANNEQTTNADQQTISLARLSDKQLADEVQRERKRINLRERFGDKTALAESARKLEKAKTTAEKQAAKIKAEIAAAEQSIIDKRDELKAIDATLADVRRDYSGRMDALQQLRQLVPPWVAAEARRMRYQLNTEVGDPCREKHNRAEYLERVVAGRRDGGTMFRYVHGLPDDHALRVLIKHAKAHGSDNAVHDHLWQKHCDQLSTEAAALREEIAKLDRQFADGEAAILEFIDQHI